MKITSSLFPKHVIKMLKGQKKHIDKERGKTKHEAPRNVNYRAARNKNNIGITALERSVVYTTGGLKAFHCTNFTLGPDIILNTKIHKKFGSRNDFLIQSMHLSENKKPNRSLWQKKERVLLANPPLQARASPPLHARIKGTTSWTTVGQAKDIAWSPNLWKLYVEAAIESVMTVV